MQRLLPLLFVWSCVAPPGALVFANRGVSTHAATCAEWLATAPPGVRWHLTDCTLDLVNAYTVRGMFGKGSLKEAYVQVAGGTGPERNSRLTSGTPGIAEESHREPPAPAEDGRQTAIFGARAKLSPGPALFVGVDSERRWDALLANGGAVQDLDVVMVWWDLALSDEAKKLVSEVRREQHRDTVVGYTSGGYKSWGLFAFVLAVFPWVLLGLGLSLKARLTPKPKAPAVPKPPMTPPVATPGAT